MRVAMALASGADVPEAVLTGMAAAADNAGQLLPARLDFDRDLVAHLLRGTARDIDAAGFRQPLDPRCNIYAVTIYVVAVNDDVPDVEVGNRRVPRIRLEAADRKADPAPLVVDVDDLGLDLVTDLVAGFRVVDLVP